MKSKILITGSSGYVGHVLSRYFSENGYMVIGLDISRNYFWQGNDYFKFYKCDTRNRQKLKDILKKERPKHVIHLAFLMNPLHDKQKNYDIDVVGSINMFEIANQVGSVLQFIQFSSASAYGAWPDNNPWIKESQELRPRDYRYGIHKKEIEERYNMAEKRNDMNLVIFRMCTAIGPSYYKKGGVVSLLVNSPLLTKTNNRFCELQFLHEDDLCALVKLVVNDEKISGTFNLAPDSFATTKDLASNKFFIPIPLVLMRGVVSVLWRLRIANIMPSAITLATYGIIVDPEKIKKRYNYRFKYTTKSAFKKTVEERKKNGTL